MFNIHVSNLGAYNRGHLVGKWLELPMDEKELENELDSILFDPQSPDEFDEEIFISDYENDYNYKVEEYEDIFKLNEFVQQLEESKIEPWILRATIDHLGSHYIRMYGYDTVIDAAEEAMTIWLGDYSNLEEHLGYALVEEGYFGIQIPEALVEYLDYEKIGRSYIQEVSGDFYKDDKNEWWFVSFED